MPLRQIILDTETTGLDPQKGHRIIEIGCVEMIDRRLTENRFHTYINPQREIDPGAVKVHGITNAFLKDKPLFSEVVKAFMAFVDGAQLVIHNAVFDIGFLNAELKGLGKIYQTMDRYCSIVDTLLLARKKHPGQRNSLDALCKRYQINTIHRALHGALIDAHLLAQVYLAMTGGQGELFHKGEGQGDNLSDVIENTLLSVQLDVPVIYADTAEKERHQERVKQLGEKNAHIVDLWEEAT